MCTTNKLFSFLRSDVHLETYKKSSKSKEKKSFCVPLNGRLLFFYFWLFEKDYWEEVCRQKIRELKIPLFHTLEKMNWKDISLMSSFAVSIISYDVSRLLSQQRSLYEMKH